MELLLRRIYKGPKYTIGHLYVNGKFFCDTIEDVDRGLTQQMPIKQILSIKIKGKTCIPYGTYEITLNIVSGKYSNFIKYPYAKPIGGRMPRLINVPGFEGILIHPGTTQDDTDGCLIVGENKVKGKVLNSQATWKRLYNTLEAASNKKEKIIIKIVYGNKSK